MAVALVKSTLKLTRIYWKLNDLSTVFFQIGRFVVLSSKIRGKMGENQKKLLNRIPLKVAEYKNKA